MSEKIDWEPVIGLEVHVQLATETKAFSPSATAFGADPNTLTDPTVLGLPGALPMFNRRALELAIKLGVATGCKIRELSRFARKQYFYPDLPKGYQISQYDEPLCEHGAVEVLFGDEFISVALTRIHLEEDAGKNTHVGSHSLVDLNRAGVPLCEVVTDPVIRSAEEASAYMRALHQLVRFLGVSEGNLEMGHFRCDANVSLRPRGTSTLGTRTELKNINSFRFVEQAITHEIGRQARILDGGGTIHQETRLWDADLGTSQSMRGKEEAMDYRYFPDPDLPPLVVAATDIDAARAALPELPVAKAKRYMGEFGLTADDARTLTAERELAAYFDEATATYAAGAKGIANWMLSELLRELSRSEISVGDSRVRPSHLAELVKLIDDQVISGKIAKDVFAKAFVSGDAPAAIVEREGLVQITDTGAIEASVREIIAANPKQAADYRDGKLKMMGFFVGQVMKATQGKANPQTVNELLEKLLGEPQK